MSTLIWAQMRHPIAPDENLVRSTTAPVEPDAPPAEAKGAPEWNEVETDPNPHLGMVTRQVASDWHQPEQYAPGWAAYANPTDSATIINAQVDSSGTAAARELAGHQGHGTYAFAIGIEPVIRDGGAFGADYFAAEDRPAQDGIANQMSRPPGLDRDDISAEAYAAKVAARDATASSVYAAWYAQAVG